MWRRVPLLLVVAVLAVPAKASATAGWVPGFDEVAPPGAVSTPEAVITPDLRTAVVWVTTSGVRAAVRPRGETFGAPFEVEAGYAYDLDAIALPDNEILVAFSGGGNNGKIAVKSLQPDGTVASARAPEDGGSRPSLAANAAGTVALAYYSYNEVRLAIRPAGADAFEPSILLTTLASNEQKNTLDVTVRDDGQVAVAIGTSVAMPPGGTARMLIARHAQGATSVETVDYRALTSAPAGTTQTALYDGAIELLADGRQMLTYRLDTTVNGAPSRVLHAGLRDGVGTPATTELASGTGSGLGPKHFGLTVDDAGRPTVWWRMGINSNYDEELRVRRATAAGAFTTTHQVLASPAFGGVAAAPFGAGRTAIVYVQEGTPDSIKGSISEAGAAFSSPVTVATAVQSAPAPVYGLNAIALAGAGEGSGLAAWPTGANYTNAAIHATAFDATPPTTPSLTAPQALTAGAVGTFVATALDDWSAPRIAWQFSDGATVSGAAVQHAFASPGSHTARATATDAVGNTAAGQRSLAVSAPPVRPGAAAEPAPTSDTRAPVLSDVRLARRVLRRGRRSTTLHFRLDERATVVARLERALRGFRSGRRCVARRPKRGRARRCTRFVAVGSPVQSQAGPGPGRLTLRLRKPGSYRVTARARDLSGNLSRPQRRMLTVRRP